MTLRLQPSDAPDTPPSPRVPRDNSGRDPRAAVFILGLVAASPHRPDRARPDDALTAFAERLAKRRSGQW